MEEVMECGERKEKILTDNTTRMSTDEWTFRATFLGGVVAGLLVIALMLSTR